MRLFINGIATNVDIRCASSWLERFIGLLGTKRLLSHQALWIRPCASVHTLGMSYPIDIVFLNDRDQVQKIVCKLQPQRFYICWGAKSAVEFAAGAVEQHGIHLGQRLAYFSRQE